MVVFAPVEGGTKSGVGGDVKEVGTFIRNTHSEADGLLAGRSTILVAPLLKKGGEEAKPVPSLIDSNSGDFATSGLEVELSAGGYRHFKLNLDPADR
jgi:hypothetical protein